MPSTQFARSFSRVDVQWTLPFFTGSFTERMQLGYNLLNTILRYRLLFEHL